MRLIILSLAGAMALASCAEQAPPAAPEEPAAPAPATDACGAAERQNWIGRARSDLPPAPAGANWRVFETGQAVTQDLRPDRLNIEIDPQRQTVVRLSCG